MNPQLLFRWHPYSSLFCCFSAPPCIINKFPYISSLAFLLSFSPLPPCVTVCFCLCSDCLATLDWPMNVCVSGLPAQSLSLCGKIWLIQPSSSDVRCATPQTQTHRKDMWEGRKIGSDVCASNFVPYYLQPNVKSTWKSLFWVDMNAFIYGRVWIFTIFYENMYSFMVQ